MTGSGLQSTPTGTLLVPQLMPMEHAVADGCANIVGAKFETWSNFVMSSMVSLRKHHT